MIFWVDMFLMCVLCFWIGVECGWRYALIRVQKALQGPSEVRRRGFSD
jgi:hypothetical protein